MFESHLYGYLSTGNGFLCVMVITIDFMLVDYNVCLMVPSNRFFV